MLHQTAQQRSAQFGSVGPLPARGYAGEASGLADRLSALCLAAGPGDPASKHMCRPGNGLPDLFDAAQWQCLAKPPHLTPRQTEVAAHVCKGLENEEIGRRLGISPHTARMHLNGLLQRLGVSNRRRSRPARPDRATTGATAAQAP
jgi:DNA-binding CsgD family transcriptional regulator